MWGLLHTIGGTRLKPVQYLRSGKLPPSHLVPKLEEARKGAPSVFNMPKICDPES